MSLAALTDDQTLQRTAQLIDFLATITDAATRNPTRDICGGPSDSRQPLVWFNDLGAEIGVRLDADGDEPVLALRPVPRVAPPAVPPAVADRLRYDPDDPDRDPEMEPSAADDPDREQRLRREFDAWRSRWLSWAETERPRRDRRRLYEQVEAAAKTLESRDDAFEGVLAAGLVCWKAPDGTTIRRHLLTEPAVATIDRSTAEVRIVRTGGRRRMEDAEVFHKQPGYQPERGRGQQDLILADDTSVSSPQAQRALHDWVGVSVSVAFDLVAQRVPEGSMPPTVPQLSPSPAFLVRPRSQVRVAEAYRQIAAALQDPNTAVPVGLAQMVVDTEPEQRDAWLIRQGRERGDLLGEDPLFPREANDEQRRVLERLRTQTGVVVQGPPGTGKTHTISNLISALLARGQRVLVTSQKDQALKVLREKIPDDIRHLCVLLAGGSRGAATELQRGLDAFADAVASADRDLLRADERGLTVERDSLRGRAASLNREVAGLREIENRQHPPVAPGFTDQLYRGTLTQIVRDVARGTDSHDWMPPVPPGAPDRPPLDHHDLLDLLALTNRDDVRTAVRADHVIPEPDQLPPPGFLAERLGEIEQATAAVHRTRSRLSDHLSRLGPPELGHLDMLGQQVQRALVACGFALDGRPVRSPDWAVRAVGDRLAGRHAGLWGHLREVRDEARQLQERLQAHGVRFVVDVPAVDHDNLGQAKGWLNAGAALLDHVRGGGRMRGLIPKKVHRDAEEMMAQTRVNGSPPTTAEQLVAALEHLGAAVAAVQLAQKWATLQVPSTGGSLPALLSELADNAAQLDRIEELVGAHRAISEHLGRCGAALDISSVDELGGVLAAIPAARQQQGLQDAERRLAGFQDHVRVLATAPQAAPELAAVLNAVLARDARAYGDATTALDTARRAQSDYRRHHELHRRLGRVHPALAALLSRTADDPAWPDRLADAAAAWAWSRARQFVHDQRNAEHERELTAECTRVDEQIRLVTARLVRTRAMLQLLDRMTDSHVRALHQYRGHMSKIGAGTGKKVEEYRRAARASMRKAQDAVPAWVVPLPVLLDNLDASRDAFDVVIVDEASQVGIEHLYLLWMAPQVIVVGDDKQCTPGLARFGDLDTVFAQNAALMPDIDHDIRTGYSQKENLYGALTNRSGRDAVIRLREHFRCVPEIINWSSQMFYPDNSGKPGLIPLRERRPGDLDPLQVEWVPDAAVEGHGDRKRNPVEARAIVARIQKCLDDPRYEGKTIGVIALQSQVHTKLIDQELRVAIPVEERQQRQIRVGMASDFQGDERDVMFLSMMVTDRPRAMTGDTDRQSFNVAASRAKDQMWLFVSVRRDELKPEDLRAELFDYMVAPPSVFGDSPGLEQVPADRPCEPFDSLFEQRVFRRLKERGYHVVPQYPVGSRSLDLVVAGADGGRVAVECDGHRYHTSPQDQANDARRDLELHRQQWQVVRVRESEFEFDPERELGRVWDLLDAHGIEPVGPPAGDPR